MTITLTPEALAARALFVGAFNVVYEDDEAMTITLHRSNGTRLAVSGELDYYRERFDAGEVATLLVELTKAVKDDPAAVIAVEACWYPGDRPEGWAWRIADGVPLDAVAAAPLFSEGVHLSGAEQHWVWLRPGAEADDLSATSLTQDVKDVIARHGA